MQSSRVVIVDQTKSTADVNLQSEKATGFQGTDIS